MSTWYLKSDTYFELHLYILCRGLVLQSRQVRHSHQDAMDKMNERHGLYYLATTSKVLDFEWEDSPIA